MSEKKFARGSGNVFADLGFADAEERQTKTRLAFEINAIIDERGLTQAKAATLLDASQPKVSALARYKLEGFSVERLMRYLTALRRGDGADRDQKEAAFARCRPHQRRGGLASHSSCAKCPLLGGSDLSPALGIVLGALERPPGFPDLRAAGRSARSRA